MWGMNQRTICLAKPLAPRLRPASIVFLVTIGEFCYMTYSDSTRLVASALFTREA